jgi:hypothetical protein
MTTRTLGFMLCPECRMHGYFIAQFENWVDFVSHEVCSVDEGMSVLATAVEARELPEVIAEGLLKELGNTKLFQTIGECDQKLRDKTEHANWKLLVLKGAQDGSYVRNVLGDWQLEVC